MKKKKLYVIILILIIILISSLSYKCGGPGPFEFDLWFLDGFMDYFHKQKSPPGEDETTGNIVKLPEGFSTKNESGDVVDEIIPPLKEDNIVMVYPSSFGNLIVGQDENIDFTQIVSNASTPPQDSIPVVDMPQDTPDIPTQDEKVTVADAEPPPDSPIKQPDDSSPIGGKPDDAPDTTDEEPSYGEKEQPSHEHDIFTYYEPDIYPNSENTLSITITVNTVTGKVDGHYDFSGFIGSSGERSAVYDFSTYLDSSDSFSATSTAMIYEDGQEVGEATLTITGELSSDMSLIAGEILDTSMGGLGILYYAYLVSQSEEQPEKENY